MLLASPPLEPDYRLTIFKAAVMLTLDRFLAERRKAYAYSQGKDKADSFAHTNQIIRPLRAGDLLPISFGCPANHWRLAHGFLLLTGGLAGLTTNSPVVTTWFETVLKAGCEPPGTNVGRAVPARLL